jgi:hypothetical protein
VELRVRHDMELLPKVELRGIGIDPGGLDGWQVDSLGVSFFFFFFFFFVAIFIIHSFISVMTQDGHKKSKKDG